MNPLRPEIQKTLRQVRWWIRRYVLVEGIAATIALACLLFWASWGIDVLYFRFSQLELPGWFRLVAKIGMAMVLAGVIIAWVALRLIRHLRLSDVALAVERKFPQLNDRLITAAEFSRVVDSPLQASMLERTADEAFHRLTRLPLKQLLNPAPLRRMVIAACVLTTSVLVLGLADARGMERWYEAYILGRENYWEPFRKNALDLHVLAQPGERIRNFDSRRIYRHPRGADLQLVATTSEGSLPPDRVSLQFLTFGGGGQQRGRVTMSHMGESQFRHTLSRVADDCQLWLHGGDFTNRYPFRVQVVDPPRIDALELQCDYPSYTGMDSQEDRRVPVVGTQAALPMETRFELIAKVNKPLVGVHLRCSRFDLKLAAKSPESPSPAQLTLVDSKTGAVRTATLATDGRDLFSPDRREFHIPLLVTTTADARLEEFPANAAFPIAVPPDTSMQIFLEDEDQIYSPEPATLTVSGIVDRPPVVDTRRVGIGAVVTRMANIPLEGRLSDDYGVEGAWFGYCIDQNADELRSAFANSPSGQKEFQLRQSADSAVESLNLIPLKLMEGQTLTLWIAAEDGDDLNGPHVSQGELFAFKIVSQEELLGRLNDREINLRQRFEQMRAEVADLKSFLASRRPQVLDLEAGNEKPESRPAVLLAAAERALHQIRKNHTESRSIEVSFRDLRQEMVNNRIDTAELLERIERRVIEPLERLNAEAFLEVDRRLGLFRLTIEQQTGSSAALDEVAPAVDELLSQMDAILAEMKERGTYQELIQSLQGVIEGMQQLHEQTENKRIEENFFSPAK